MIISFLMGLALANAAEPKVDFDGAKKFCLDKLNWTIDVEMCSDEQRNKEYNKLAKKYPEFLKVGTLKPVTLFDRGWSHLIIESCIKTYLVSGEKELVGKLPDEKKVREAEGCKK